MNILWRRAVSPPGAPLSCVGGNDSDGQYGAIDGDLEHLEPRLGGEVRHIDAREGIIGDQAHDTSGRRGLYRAAQSQGRDWTPVAARVHHDLVRLQVLHLRHGIRLALA